MAIPITFSERTRRSTATSLDVYTYDNLPDRILRQLRALFDQMFSRWAQQSRRESGLYGEPVYQNLEPLAIEIRLSVDDPSLDKLQGSAYFPELIRNTG